MQKRHWKRSLTVFDSITHCDELWFDPEENIRLGYTKPPKPTDAAPGSDEKIRVLRQRVLAGQPLHVEGDRVDCSGLESASVNIPWLGGSRTRQLWADIQREIEEERREAG